MSAVSRWAKLGRKTHSRFDNWSSLVPAGGIWYVRSASDWYDEWAVVEAEDWRQLRLHALDALTERLIALGHYADATSAALAAVKAEPLRETAHAALIRVHLAEGNQAEALAAFERFRELLQAELGLEPSPMLQALVKHLRKP